MFYVPYNDAGSSYRCIAPSVGRSVDNKLEGPNLNYCTIFYLRGLRGATKIMKWSIGVRGSPEHV